MRKEKKRSGREGIISEVYLVLGGEGANTKRNLIFLRFSPHGEI